MSCILGVTGGIGSGKSTFTTELLREYPAQLFDCDHAARELFENDASVQAQLRSTFPEVLVNDQVDRLRLRSLVFSDPVRRLDLEQILHPRIRQQWMTLAKRSRTNQENLLVDIPLLFETGVESSFDAIIVVGCSPATQVARLMTHRKLEPEIAESIISVQMPLSKKLIKADHLVWNESSLPHLKKQSNLLAVYFKQRYG